ncbi:MAG TPA: antibiotic biosynthesis monooxygenase [Candidatus Lustribacter sp.]|nr:antibiotic biosynthesis monooxygenase [Candidatus Lustribacter sp.]
MPSVRVLYCSNQRDLPERIERLRERAAAVRAEPGCLEFDTFRDVEYPENFAQLELWASAQAFDAHWAATKTAGIFCAVDNLLAPHHRGTPDYPRRDGNNGAEFYQHQTFMIAGQIFVSTDPGERIESVRWPSRSGVRIIIQSSTEPAGDRDFFPYAAETRAQKGCLEFAFYRSLEFPENNLHLELWQGPPVVYDEHFYLRTLHRLYGIGLARPPSTPVDRRYGTAGFEFYQHGFFAPAGDLWQPENPAERLATVRWT